MQDALHAMRRWAEAKAAMPWPDRAEQDYGFARAAGDMQVHRDAYLQAGCGVGKTGAMFWAPEFVVQGESMRYGVKDENGVKRPEFRLVPNSARVIVSAFTKAQAQQNMQTAQRGVDAGLFKEAVELRGRSEYVCLRRWDRLFLNPKDQLHLPEGSRGLRADVEAARGRKLSDKDWAAVRSDADRGCRRKKCGDADYANRARDRALESGVVVCTNHTVVALDAAYEGAIFDLNHSDVLLLDEGHQVADAFRTALGATITERRFTNLADAFYDESNRAGLPIAPYALDAIRAVIDMTRTEKRADTEELPARAEQYLLRCAAWAQEVRECRDLIPSEDGRKRIEQMSRRLQDDCLRAAEAISSSEEVAWVEWDDNGRGAPKLEVRPLDVDDFVRKVMDIPSATLVMSATLSGQPMKDLGVPESRLIDAGSPFDFSTKRRGYVADYQSKGNEERRMVDLVRVVRKVVSEGGGVIVVSKTTRRQVPGVGWMSQIEEAERALTKAGFRVGVQQDTRDIPELVAKLTDGDVDVVIGKRAVGEGINIEGPRLSAVIFLDRPYPYMGDPVLDARKRRMGDRWALPNAIMKVNLAQGIGRLIRTVDDEGIVVLFDSRGADAFRKAMLPSAVYRFGG